MQKRAVYAQTIHRGLDLPSDLPTLPHAADDQFSALAHAARNAIHGPGEALLCSCIRLIDVFEVGEGRPLCGYHMDRRDYGREIIGLGIGGIGGCKRPCIGYFGDGHDVKTS